MTNEELLAEIDDLLVTTPAEANFVLQQPTAETLQWLGRAAAVLEQWNWTKMPTINTYVHQLQSGRKVSDVKGLSESSRELFVSMALINDQTGPAYRGLRTLLYQAQHDLRMKTVGPLTLAISDQKPFQYFDELRKIIEGARIDLLFVDPFIDPEFIAKYLPQVAAGVPVRLLTFKHVSALLPAVDAYIAQTGAAIQVISASGLHDRYVFIDKVRCYQSGASFKDGAKRSPTTLTQIVDAFDAMLSTYETKWSAARVERG
jgi:hypothetical protein